jgi:hypothetical protein
MTVWLATAVSVDWSGVWWVAIALCLLAAFFLRGGQGRRFSSRRQEIRTRLPLYRSMGFFRDHESLTDEELAAVLDRNMLVRPSSAWFDLYLLSLDERRVWLHDLALKDNLEGEGDRVFPELLRDWAALSEGAFAPVDVMEDWSEEVRPVRIAVTYKLGTQLHRLDPANVGGNIDLGIVRLINQTLQGSEYRFCAASDGSAGFGVPCVQTNSIGSPRLHLR